MKQQADSPAGRRWIPSTYEILQSAGAREEITCATIEFLRVATHNSGCSFNPDTDFSTFAA